MDETSIYKVFVLDWTYESAAMISTIKPILAAWYTSFKLISRSTYEVVHEQPRNQATSQGVHVVRMYR